MQVRVPHVDWHRVFQNRPAARHSTVCQDHSSSLHSTPTCCTQVRVPHVDWHRESQNSTVRHSTVRQDHSSSLHSTPTCCTQVRVPHVDWHRVFQDSPSTYTYSILSKGYDRYHLGNGLELFMVDNPAHAQDAVNRLRASMQVCVCLCVCVVLCGGA